MGEPHHPPTPPTPQHASPMRPAPHPGRVADLQAEVASLRGHKDRCERAMLSLLREMLQLRACGQLQDAELKRLQQDVRQAVQAPDKEVLEVSWHRACPGSPAPGPGLVCAGRAVSLRPTAFLTVPWCPEPEPHADPGQEVPPPATSGAGLSGGRGPRESSGRVGPQGTSLPPASALTQECSWGPARNSVGVDHGGSRQQRPWAPEPRGQPQGRPQAAAALVCQAGGGPGGADSDQEEAGAPGL